MFRKPLRKLLKSLTQSLAYRLKSCMMSIYAFFAHGVARSTALVAVCVRSFWLAAVALWSLFVTSTVFAVTDYSAFQTGVEAELAPVPALLVSIGLYFLPVVLTVYVLKRVFNMAGR